MYVLYQQGIGISNVYFLHVATILWLFISTNSIVRIRSGLDRKVAKNKTEPHSGVQHIAKNYRGRCPQRPSERAKNEAWGKGAKNACQKEAFESQLLLFMQPRQQRQQQSSAYFMAFFAMAVGAFGRLGQPTELLSDLPCRAWMRFYVWPSELFATATEHIYFLNFELNWNCINVLDKRCYHQIICECLERGKSFQNILQ